MNSNPPKDKNLEVTIIKNDDSDGFNTRDDLDFSMTKNKIPEDTLLPDLKEETIPQIVKETNSSEGDFERQISTSNRGHTKPPLAIRSPSPAILEASF